MIGSGIIVPNMMMGDWDKHRENLYGFECAIETNEKMKKFMLNGDHQQLFNFHSKGNAFDLAIRAF